MDHFILNDKEPVAVPMMVWAGWFEKADRTVAKTTIVPNSISVSTVFLGLDHGFGVGPPLLFETLVIGGESDGLMDRYSTWDESEAGHLKIVEDVKQRLSGENVVEMLKWSKR